MLELTLRSTAVLVVAWALTRMMPRATAATRHLVWHGALLASLLVPLATVVNMPKVAVMPPVPAAQVLELLEGREPAASRTGRPDAPRAFVAASPLASVDLVMVARLGTAAVALWFLAGWIATVRLSRRALAAPLAWQMEVNALCDRLRLDRAVRLGIIEAHSSPLATGLFHATILLPRAAAAWSAERRRAVLLHELAHIKRHDCRVQLVAHAACALYWFNPLVWLAASRLRRERERACDDQVLRLGAMASSYAAHLLEIARELRPTMRPSAALAMARPSELEGRLLWVLAAERRRVPFRATRWLVLAVMTLTTAVALGATSHTPMATAPLSSARPRYIVATDVLMSSEPAPEGRARAAATLESSADPQEREHATLALAFTSGSDVIPALLQALADPDAQVREKAAIGLALRRDARVVEPLIDALSDPDSQVREKAAIALGTSGDARAQEPLRRALDDPDSEVREKAVAALVLLAVAR